MDSDKEMAFILWFKELGIADVPIVGGKNASLGEMYQNLSNKGVAVPNGFAITAQAYNYFLEQTGIKQTIQDILKTLNTHDLKNLQDHGHRVRETILEAELPDDLKTAIEQAYIALNTLEGGTTKSEIDVAVRSSATAEDMPDASFAGQQETFLNIQGAHDVIDATKRCMASLFTNRAISYRADKGYDHFNVSLSVGVQKMVRSDEAGSGVMFSIDTESGFPNAVLINAAYGLGEMVVQGKVEPDEYYVFKPTLLDGVSQIGEKLTFKYRPIVGKSLGHKEDKMIYSLEGNTPVREVPVPEEDRKKFVLTDDEVLQLAYWACLIEQHYQKPMDMEWAKDGLNNRLYIVQARPETVHSQANKQMLEEYIIQGQGKKLVEGVSVGSKIGQGKVRVLKDTSHIHDFQKGEVLVTEITDPDWEPIMKIASAIVTNSGGRTSHAAIVSRELGIPCVVGTKTATATLSTGQAVTVSCAEGERGYIYEGLVPFELKKTDLGAITPPKTDIMQIVGDPSRAFDFGMIPNRGVGLARLEMIILNAIKVHPLALLHFDELQDEEAKKKITELTRHYPVKPDFFIDQLAIGVGRIAAAFHPNQVIVRLSDFKSNEYANLIGGRQFEPHEENPMIGWRGASRYYSKEYKDAFVLECKAMQQVRNEMGLTNVKLMIPFCRTPEEGRKVIQILAENGLKQGDNGLEIYMMCEIPSNVILAEEFIQIFDGFSIGSNDLTQLTLGLDRDSGLVAHIYDERNPAIKKLLAQAIATVHAAGKKIGICGQAPSDFPEIAEFLVAQGIDTISVTPDTCLKTLINISDFEKNRKK